MRVLTFSAHGGRETVDYLSFGILHYSITSSASASNLSGTVKPRRALSNDLAKGLRASWEFRCKLLMRHARFRDRLRFRQRSQLTSVVARARSSAHT
jgi:hypothetical protein